MSETTTSSTTIPYNTHDTSTQVNAIVKINCTRSHAPTEKGRETNIQSLVLIVIIAAVLTVATSVVTRMAEHCGDHGCARCLRTSLPQVEP